MNMKKNNSIKRAQSQAGLSFAERKNFRPMAKILTLLVLLMTVATGAWAQEETLLTTIESTGNADFKSGSKTFDNIATVTFSGDVNNDGDHWGWFYTVERTLTVTAAEGYTITRVKFYTHVNSAFDEVAPFEAILAYDGGPVTKVNGNSIGQIGVTKIEVYGTDAELVDEVIAKITAIGTVTYTPESKALIDAARTAYDALTAAQQARVTNYSTLTDAETTYAAAEEVAFTEGVELTPTGTKNEWALAATPALYVELEVEYETALALSETTDNSAALTEWDGYEADVTLTRTLQTGGWNTFCLPFGMTLADFKTAIGDDQVQVKELASSSLTGETLTLNFDDAASIVAGKPYLVKISLGSNVDLSTVPFNGVIISETAQTTVTDYANFVPVFSPTNLEGGNTNILFVTGGNTLTYPSADGNINGFRAYFYLHDAPTARAFAMSFDDAAGIETIDYSPLNIDHSVYDLQGRRMANGQSSTVDGQSLKKGVYIVNGKKTVIK